jgi:small-conductance mechanosensitive channel
MRPFEVNDRVKVGDLIGDVQSMGIMFTRLKDLEGRLTEVPNNNVLQNNIINFTSSSKEGSFAVFIDVTLGYDIPPKKARALMKKAALATPGVLKDPVPKVLLREFHNHAVEYRLRAYITDAPNMMFIRSSVMENMMTMFHGEGLEILSPAFEVQRQGMTIETEMPHLVKRGRTTEESTVSDGLSMFDSIGGQYTKDLTDQSKESADGGAPKSP